jgi:hypothetical protein
MMTNETAKGLLDFLLPQLEQEFATTRNVLASVPPENCSYKPSERCMSAIELANHIAGSEVFFLSGVVNGAFDWKDLQLKTPAEVLAYCDQNIHRFSSRSPHCRPTSWRKKSASRSGMSQRSLT